MTMSLVFIDENGVQTNLDEVRAKAAMYDALRAMHWWDGNLAVVKAKDLPLGTQTYSGDMLDEVIAGYTGQILGDRTDEVSQLLREIVALAEREPEIMTKEMTKLVIDARSLVSGKVMPKEAT